MDAIDWKKRFRQRVRKAGRKGLSRTELNESWNWFRYRHNRLLADAWIAEMVRAGDIVVATRSSKAGPHATVYKLP